MSSKKVKIQFSDAPDGPAVPAEVLGLTGCVLPDGGKAGEVLYVDAEGQSYWGPLPPEAEIPAGGTLGQILVMGSSGLVWADAPVIPVLPEGTEGQIVVFGEDGLEAADAPVVPAVPTAAGLADGEYKLVVAEGVATWVLIA